MQEVDQALLHYLIILASALFILSLLLVRYYASPRTSIFIQFLSTVAFASGFSGTFLLPVDLSLAEDQDDNDNNITMLPWHILFWMTSLLAWFILPIVKEMLLSGEFTFLKSLKDGIRTRIKMVLIFGLIGTILIIWLAIHLRTINIIPVLITFGNTYGLLFVSLLLGYGLVALPRSLWRQAKPSYELRKAQIMAVAADEALFDAVWDLQDCEYEIDCAVSRIVDLDESDKADIFYKYCVNELLHRKNETAELKPDLHARRMPSQQRRSRATSGSNNEGGGGGYESANTTNYNQDDSYITDSDKPAMEELVRLNRRLKHAQEKLLNTEKHWESVVERSRYFQDIMDGVVTSSLPTSSTSSNSAQMSYCGTKMRWIWIKFLRGISYRFVAIVTSVMSGAILWSEATLGSRFNLSPFSWVQQALSKDDENGVNDIIFQIAVLVPLLYMSICVATSLFKMTMFGPFCLRGNRQSHGAALVLNAQFLARLQFPLGYNYLLMLKYDTSSCAFSKFIGQMSVVPLFGTAFSVYAPLLIIALCVFTLFDVYPKLMSLLRIDHEDAILVGDKETLDAKVSEGISLLRQRLDRKESSNQASLPSRSDIELSRTSSSSSEMRGFSRAIV